MKRQYHKWFSDRLGREMELLVFGHAGAKVLVFPTREGRFYDYENWGLVESLRHSIDGGHIRLCCVDGVDSEASTAGPPLRWRAPGGTASTSATFWRKSSHSCWRKTAFPRSSCTVAASARTMP